MIVSTLLYAFDDSRVLMLHRRKPPNLGLWSPPGGKLEPGETPLTCAIREFREETGLEPTDVTLRVVVSELDTVTRAAWLMFVFSGKTQGVPLTGAREGDCAWVPVEQLSRLPRPPADEAILAAVLGYRPDEARFATAPGDSKDCVARLGEDSESALGTRDCPQFLRVEFRAGELVSAELE